jgi:hypothetical protein
MIKVLFVMVLMTVAQLLPSCGNSPRPDDGGGARAQIIGWIDEKRQRQYETFPYMFVINSQEYGVPYEFWLEANVGDLVKYDGERWTFVRRVRR